MYKILIVDDELDILEFLSFNLQAQGWEVRSASDGLTGLSLAKEWLPDLIILDVMMPGMDGITLCGELRKFSSLDNTLITILTARSEDYSQIAGFDSGADDYISKPIRPAVLISRLKALLKRKDLVHSELFASGNNNVIIIDSDRYIATVNGVKHHLPRKEFLLLKLLMSSPGRVFSRDEIYSKIWGDDIVGDRTIDVHVRKLRERIGDHYIQTLKGIGYKMNLD